MLYSDGYTQGSESNPPVRMVAAGESNPPRVTRRGVALKARNGRRRVTRRKIRTPTPFNKRRIILRFVYRIIILVVYRVSS